MKKLYPNTVLTKNTKGHTLHHNQVFSWDGQWIVFDGRNEDSKIGETTDIGIVNILTGEIKLIYQTKNPNQYGPGVGAASFNPYNNKVIFIHGLTPSTKQNPYAITRRTGAGIDLSKPFEAFNYDARDLSPPFKAGTLRGGTHSHGWSGDGKLISFTYNDELVAPELRTVGILIPTNKTIIVDKAVENKHGTMYAAIIADVITKPKPGTDQICKAFDECWIGKSGYINKNDQKIEYAIAFQGNTINLHGEIITEVFLVDINEKLLFEDKKAVGRLGQRPQVPQGIKQRRLTFTQKGLSDTRHWLRSSPDGKYIYALAKDNSQINQIIQIKINTGKIVFLSNVAFSIDFTFNLSHCGNKIAYIANNQLFLFDIESKTANIISADLGKMIGTPSFSPDDKVIVYNCYIKSDNGIEYLQIVKIDLV